MLISLLIFIYLLKFLTCLANEEKPIMYSLVLGKILHKIPIKVLTTKAKLSSRLTKKNAGFTLIELLVVVTMIGVLSAIVAPSWLTFVNRQRANKANDVLLSALQEAQREAKKQKLGYSVSFRTDNNIPQIAIHPKDFAPTNYWRNLGKDLEIQPGQIVLGTNLTNRNTNATASPIPVDYPVGAFDPNSPKTITFDYTGALDLLVKTNSSSITSVQNDNIGNKGLIVAVAVAKPGEPTQETNLKRCVIIKTILGSVKSGKDLECD